MVHGPGGVTKQHHYNKLLCKEETVTQNKAIKFVEKHRYIKFGWPRKHLFSSILNKMTSAKSHIHAIRTDRLPHLFTCTITANRNESWPMFPLHPLQEALPLLAYSALYPKS